MAVFTHDSAMSGRVTTDSVSVSAVAGDATSQMRVQWGLTAGLGNISDVSSASAVDERLIVVLDSLAAGTVYHYKLQGKLVADDKWSLLGSVPAQQTKTAAATGAACRSITWADPHITKQLTDPDWNPDLESRYTAFLAHVADPLADFYLSLGDELVSIGGQWPSISSQADMDAWWALWRNFTAPVLGQRPFYLALGNHEPEAGYTMEPTAGDYRQRWHTISRKRYVLLPNDGENDATLAWQGDETGEKVGGQDEGNVNPLENYYTWSYGDADWFVIHPHRYTEIGGTSPVDDRSHWTLGADQLAWFEAALAASSAKWKIVCTHHVVGSCDEGPYGRCGCADVLHEDNYMADTGDGEGLHDKMVAAGVNYFVKGHDHLMAAGHVGTICYITCPSPAALLGGLGKSAYGYETEDYWLKDYGYVEWAWSSHQCVAKLHHIAYDDSFTITDTVVHTDVTSDLDSMAISPTVWTGAMLEDSGVSSMARVMGHDGATIVQRDMDTIRRTIYNKATGELIQQGQPLTVADIVFDTLQTDDRWTADAIGYNFRDDIPAAKFADGDATYRIEYKFTPVDGEAWRVPFEATATEVLGS